MCFRVYALGHTGTRSSARFHEKDALMLASLSHYRILEQIGAGGMGVVYRAHDDHLDCDVAVKVLPGGEMSDPSARKRFRKEAQLLSKIKHPNIAVVHDFDSQDGTDFLVQELIEGVSLDAMLRAGPLSNDELIRLATQLAEGVAAAHEHGIIHRDLKPANIRVTPDGRLKILDFGLAMILNRESNPGAATASLTEIKAFAGTLPYMAPEQLLGKSLDVRTDLWAFGCVLYAMGTGKTAFPGSGPVLVEQILHDSPLLPSRLNPALPVGVEEIILKCMEKDRLLRYQSAREIAVDFHRLVSSTTSTHFVIPQSRAKRLPNSLVAMLLLLLLGVLGWFAAQRWRIANTRNANSIAVLPFTDLSAGHDQEYFSDGLAEEILNELARMPGVKVVARTSAFQFKGKNEDTRAIGRKLNVQNVLEGSVRREGTRVRITAQLIKANDGFHIWSESYDRDLKDVLAVQGEIANDVATALQLKLLGAGESPRSKAPQKVAPEAYQYFLQARYFAHMGDKESSQKAIEYINKAIERDPNYAAAYAWRASLTLRSGSMAWTNYATAADAARGDLERAIELGPELSDAYRVLSQLQAIVESSCRHAEVTITKALKLAPGDADNLGQSGFVQTCLGRKEEAVSLAKQALARDPLQPERYRQLGQSLRDGGQYDAALAALHEALDLNPNNDWVHETLGEVYLAKGRPDEALAEMQKEPPGFFRYLGLALANHALSRRDDSDKALASFLKACSEDCGYQIAQVYAYRGEADKAFEWLNRACARHDGGLMLLKTDLLMNNIRGDSRYSELLRRLDLPE